MKGFFSVVALPRYATRVTELLAHQETSRMVQELNIPNPRYGDVLSVPGWEDACKRLVELRDNSTGFGMFPRPHLTLGERFFALEQNTQRFVLRHELRHAYQLLVDFEWRGYVRTRASIAQQVNPKELAVGLLKFLSAPLEVDAQEYAFSRFPEEGSATVLSRSQEIAGELAKYPNPVAHTLQATIVLLPMVYEWRKLLERGLISQTSRYAVANNAQAVLNFLAEKTRAGSDARVNEFSRQYLTAEPGEFLGLAQDFFAYLVTLKD